MMEKIRLAIEKKLMTLESDSTQQLWQKCRMYHMVQLDIFCVVKTLTSRCSLHGTTPNFFPKDAPSILVALLEKSDRPEVLIMICGLISVFCNSYSTAKVDLVRKNILYNLLSLIRKCLCPKEEEKRRQSTIENKHNAALYHQEECMRKTEVVQQVTALLVYFSLGPKPCHDGFIFEGAIRQMVDMLDWRNPQLHPVSPKVALHTKQLVMDKTLVATRRVMPEVAAEISYKMLFGHNTPDIIASQPVLELDLYDTTHSSKDVNIQDELRASGLVLSSAYSDIKERAGGEWVDVVVQTVLSPCQCWAWIGSDTRQLMEKVKSQLTVSLKQDELLRDLPKYGDLIMVGRDENGPYRACVLDVTPKKIKVFSLDHGFTRLIPSKWLFRLEDSLKTIPPQAVYCQLKGVIIPSKSTKITENIQSVFCNLAGQPSLAMGPLNTNHAQAVFTSWALSEPSTMSYKAIVTLSNLAREPGIRKTLGQRGMVSAMLDLCKRTHEVIHMAPAQDVVEAALSLLANLLFENTENKERLMVAEGVELMILKYLASDTIPEKVKVAATNVLRIFVGYAKLQNYCSGSSSNTSKNRRRSQPTTANHSVGRKSVSPRKQETLLSITECTSSKLVGRNNQTNGKYSHSDQNSCTEKSMNTNVRPPAVNTLSPVTSPEPAWKGIGRGAYLLSLASGQKPGAMFDPQANSQNAVNCTSDTTRTLQSQPAIGMGRGKACLVLRPAECNASTGTHTFVQASNKQDYTGASSIHGRTSQLKSQLQTKQNDVRKHLDRTSIQPGENAGVSPLKSFQMQNSDPEFPPDFSGVNLNISDREGDCHDDHLRQSLESKWRHQQDDTGDMSASPSWERGCPDGRDVSSSPDVKYSRPGLPISVCDQFRNQSDRKYIKGEVVELRCDETHDLCQDRFVSDIRTTFLMMAFSSFLNSGLGGMIYYGIRSSGKVHGIQMNYDQRDTFRIGLDKAINQRIFPVVVSTQYDIVFAPVYKTCSVTKMMEVIVDTYVIEIRVDAVKGCVYAFSGKCYFREDDTSVEGASQDIHRRAVEEQEKRYFSDLQYLEKEIARLKQAEASK